MDTSTDTLASSPAATTARPIAQYTRPQILGVWAAAALPMAALAWVVAPWFADRLGGPTAGARSLLLSLGAGLAWQFALVLLLVHREQGSLRWAVLKDALWLRAPRSPRTGRVGGLLWLVLVPAVIVFGAEQLLPSIPPPAGRDLSAFLGSPAGADLFSGSWGWFGLVVAMVVLNTVLGEELLFRGVLLPRMNAAFGRADWVANGVLFATYHLHMPWVIPTALLDTFALAYPSRRYRSAVIGIVVHSTQSVLVLALTLALVLR
jgi:membrane protease YdiL (CAAX protease family)